MLVNLHFAVALFFMSVFIEVLKYVNKEIFQSNYSLKDTFEIKDICSLSYFHPISLVSIFPS